MKENLLLKIITSLLVPLILGFSFYIQMNGDSTPGGGFQAGIILGSGFILYGLVFNASKPYAILNEKFLNTCSILGGLLYGCTGMYCILKGGQFLNYYYLTQNIQKSQQLGIEIVEAAVGITVSTVTLKIFYYFVRQDN